MPSNLGLRAVVEAEFTTPLFSNMQRRKLTLFFLQTNRFYEIEEDRDELAGTASTCTLRLDSYLEGDVTTISRHHFRITDLEQNGYVIIDLQSLHGTQVNGVPLKPITPYRLQHGDIVTLAGNSSFRILVQLRDSSFPEVKSNTLLPPSSSVRLQYDFRTDTFILDGNIVPPTYFTKLEHNLLRYFCLNTNQVCTFDALAVHVWQGWIQNNTIAKTVSNLRKKLNNLVPGAGEVIKTVRSRGFVCSLGNHFNWPD